MSVIAGEVLSGNMRTGVVGYGDKWRRLRKSVHCTPGSACKYCCQTQAKADLDGRFL